MTNGVFYRYGVKDMRRGNGLPARDETWITSWLDTVGDGRASMSQRARSSVDMRGGLDAGRAAESAVSI
jgi:hypothetical protein